MLLTGVRDLDMKILNELEDVDLVNVCQTNRAADAICTDQNFWLNRIQTKLVDVPENLLGKYKGGRSWSEYYIQDLKDKEPTNVGAEGYILNSALKGRIDLIVNMALRFPDQQSKQYIYNLALRVSSQYGHIDMVKYLVEHGANIHTGQYFPVKWAYMSGHNDVVDYLVSVGAPDPRIN